MAWRSDDVLVCPYDLREVNGTHPRFALVLYRTPAGKWLLRELGCLEMPNDPKNEDNDFYKVTRILPDLRSLGQIFSTEESDGYLWSHHWNRPWQLYLADETWSVMTRKVNASKRQ